MQTVRKYVRVFYHFQLSFIREENVTIYLSERESPTVNEILSILPLDISKGAYHFRFKIQINEGSENTFVWADIDNIMDKAPQIDDSIFIKILSLKNPKQRKQQKIDVARKTLINRDENLMDFVNLSHNLIPNPANQPLITEFPPSQQDPFHQLPNILQPVVSKIPNSIDMINPVKNHQSPFPSQNQGIDISSLSQQQIDNLVKKWGYADGKRINNLITLLSSLHQIWPEWQQVPLTDLLRPELVHSAFKKAVLKVHPDKNTHRHFNQKYLSKQVFQLLNQSRKQMM